MWWRTTPFRTPMRGNDALCFLYRTCVILGTVRLISQARCQELIERTGEVIFDTGQWVCIEEYDAVCISSIMPPYLAYGSLACNPEGVESRKYSPKSIICGGGNKLGPRSLRKWLSIGTRHGFGPISHALANCPVHCDGHTYQSRRSCDTV